MIRRITLILLFLVLTASVCQAGVMDIRRRIASENATGGWTVGGRAYNNRICFTSDNTVVDAAQTNAPVHLQIDSSSGISGDNLQAFLDELCQGDDLGESRKKKVAFTNSVGTQLYYDPVNVYCNGGVGEWADYWFEADALSDVAGSDFCAYFDKDVADNNTYAVPANVWDGWSAHGVWHMQGANAAGCTDSSGYGNDVASDTGTPDYQHTGLLGYSINFTKASSEQLVISDSDSLSFMTCGGGTEDCPFSSFVVVNMDDATSFPFFTKDDGTNMEYAFISGGTDKLTYYLFDDVWAVRHPRYYNTAVTGQQGSYITTGTTYDGQGGPNPENGINIYLNGAVVDNGSAPFGTYVDMENEAVALDICRMDVANIYCDGKIDEIIIFAIQLSDAQQKVLENTAKDTLFEYSAIETNP